MADDPAPLELPTPHGPARVHLHRPATAPRAALILGHGAGGSVSAPDLQAAAAAALAADCAVALVEQPYRVAGRRSPPPARTLDAAWNAVVEQLRSETGEGDDDAGPLTGLPLIPGGRSSGARVACRTAADTQAIGVLCLAFPLQPPRRRGADADPPSRLSELDSVTVPTLVVQGVNDRFGMPPAADERTVVQVPGDHSLKSGRDRIQAAIGDWLDDLLAG